MLRTCNILLSAQRLHQTLEIPTVKSLPRSLITLSMNAFLILAILLTLSTIIRFFDVLQAHAVGAWIANLGILLTPELGLPVAITPFGGVFDSDMVAVIVIIIFCEWMLSVGRNRL